MTLKSGKTSYEWGICWSLVDLMWFWLVLAWGWEFSLSSILELGELQIEYYSIWWIKLRNHYSSTLKITGMQHHHITPQILYICRKIWGILWWGLFFILKALWKRKLRNYNIIFTIEDFWTVLLSLRLTHPFICWNFNSSPQYIFCFYFS